MMPVKPALELRKLTRRWPGRESVFSGLSLSVSRGKITCLLGPSGCGKSTLLRCAASLDTVESGQIFIDGEPVTEPSPGRQLILQDDRQLLPWLSVKDNVSFPVRMGSACGTGIADSEELLSLVGLADAGSLFPAQLSGGMKQRAVLARALAAEPGILLLDEPFAALDSEIRKRLHVVLKDIHREKNLTILLVTHDVAEALILADTIIYMDSQGLLSPPEENPLRNKRDAESNDFFRETVRMRRRYESLVDAVNV